MRGIKPLIHIDVLSDSLGIGVDATQDAFLRRLAVMASDTFETLIDRKVRARTYTAEQSNGSGTRLLRTKQWPILSVASLYDDIDNDFTSDTLFASTDYEIKKLSGLIEIRWDSQYIGTFRKGNNNVQITYDAGFGYMINLAENDRIDFDEGGSALVSTLTAGEYTAEGLATEIKTQLDADGAATFTVTYDGATDKFTIASDGGTFSLLWSSGSNKNRSVGITLGYDTTADDTGATSYTADDPAVGIPSDIEQAVLDIAIQMYKMLPQGKDKFGVISETFSGAGGSTTNRFSQKALSDYAKMVIASYRRVRLPRSRKR